MQPPPKDVWAVAAAYERYVGRWSRPVAREFVRWLQPRRDAHWLDVGTGTGALSATVLSLGAPRHVSGVDASWSFVAHARAQLMTDRAQFAVADAHHLPFAAASFDLVVSGLVLNFLARPDAALEGMRQVTRPGGTIAVYVWDYAGRMDLMRHFWDAAVAVDSRATELDEGRRFPICKPEALQRLFSSVGLEDVAVREIDVPTRFADFDDYWSPFEGGQGPAPAFLSSLDPEKRARVRERAKTALPFNGDGSVDLIARAWAVRGTTPPR